MASRRLNSDRFFTDDYTPEVYTQAGLDWIADNSMVTVLLRHHPELRPALQGVDERVRGLAALLSASGPDLSVRPGRLDA